MTKHETLARVDWPRVWRTGEDLARDQVRRGDPVDERAIMWALLCDAARTAAAAYTAPPRSSWPRKSTLPEAPSEVSQWALMSAYLKGELDEMPTDDSRPPIPSAEQISMAEAVLYLWHNYALKTKGDWSRMRKAVYLKACGCPDRKVRAVTGFSRDRIKHARRVAMDDMIERAK